MIWRKGKPTEVVSDELAPDAVKGSEHREYYDGGYLVAESVAPSLVPLIVEAPAMLALLKKLWARIDSGYLVRSTVNDGNSDFYLKAIEFCAELRQIEELLIRVEHPEPNKFGVTEFDPNTGCRPNSEMNEDGTVKGIDLDNLPF